MTTRRAHWGRLVLGVGAVARAWAIAETDDAAPIVQPITVSPRFAG